MSKRLDELNKEYEKVKEIAGRKKAGYDSYMSVWEDSDNNLLIPPYGFALATTTAIGGNLISNLTDYFGMAKKETPSGRVRNKFEQATATIFKNIFAGLGTGVVGLFSLMVGLSIAAIETPFTLPKAIIEAPFIARNKAYNRRIEKAKIRLKELEREICKEVQNPTKDEDFEAKKAPKIKVAKKSVLTTSKENLKEENEPK